jgi:hypothetical protein
MSVMCAALVAAVLQSSPQPAAALPVVAERLITGSMSRVQLTNKSDQPVTAWSMAIVTPTANGTHRVVETIDAYLSEATEGIPGATAQTTRLMPGQSREIALDPLPPTARVEMVAVVLNDGHALGDAQVIGSIFDRRAKEREQLRMVVDAFNVVLQQKHGAAALEDLKARFASTAGVEDSVPHRAAVDAIDSYLRRATAGNTDQIDGLVRQYAAFVQKQYELAVRHATRRE